MELKSYLGILRRRKLIIIAAVLTTLAVVIFGLSMMTPSYAATVTLRIATTGRGSLDYLDYSAEYADRIMNTYAEIVADPAMAEELMTRLKLENPPEIYVDIPANTELFRIIAEDPDPEIAALVANTAAELLMAQIQEFSLEATRQFQQTLAGELEQMAGEIEQDQQELDGDTASSSEDAPAEGTLGRAIEQRWSTYDSLWEQYEQSRARGALQSAGISIISPATVPTSPSGPDTKKYIALALVVALAGGLGLAFLFENLDTTLYDVDQIKASANVPLIGEIPRVNGLQGVHLVKEGSCAEAAFHRLYTTVTVLSSSTALKSLMVTSAEPGEGKSTVAANLALAFAQGGQSVVLVDCNLRTPTLHSLFDLPNECGLSTILEQKSPFTDALYNSKVAGLSVITSGPVSAKPAELLGSTHMHDLVKELEREFDILICDTPAFLTVADASALAPLMDAVVLIIESGRTRQETARAAYEQLTLVRANLAGMVVNQVRS